MKKVLSSVFCIILAVCLFAAVPAPRVFAEDAWIEGTYEMFGQTVTWQHKYTDEFFQASPDVYDHDLARLSLGLALSASRDVDHMDAQDDRLIAFLQKMGFGQIETDVYRTEPTADSICYGLASKEIGDATLVACAVCGGEYGKEWASNLTVGDSVRSDGFQDASVKVQAAVSDYLKKHEISGKTKLWITGYSRAAAVSNITAADFTDAGVFDDVYAYTFATPRTTREPGSYPNIFNIIQKEDVVPKVPLADWGYQRYGNDLFLVSPETDSGCGAVMDRTAELYREMTSAVMISNSEINYELRTVIDYLLSLMQDSATYTQYLQPLIVDIMTESNDTKNALQVLMEALNRYSTDDPAAGKELKAMREYVGTLLNVYVLKGAVNDLPPERWDPALGALNLFNAHFPFEYLAMLYASDDPSDLFSANTDYIRLVIYADADITIADDHGVIKEIRSDGTELVNGEEAPYSLPDSETYRKKTVITLPADQSYRISVKSAAWLPQTISYTGLLCSGRTVRAQADDMYSFLMNKGDTAEILTSSNGRTIDPAGSDHTDISVLTDAIYSPTTAMRLENNSVARLTISGLVNRLLLVIVFLIVQSAASLILMFIRRKRGKRRAAVFALVWHGVIAAVFAVLEVAMWYFVPVLPLVKIIPGVLTAAVILIYALKGCLVESRKWKAFWILAGALVVYMAAESLLIGRYTILKVILLMAVYAGFLAAAFILLWRGKKGIRDVVASLRGEV